MIEYSEARMLAVDGSPEARRGLAERADVQPEILYFLAKDEQAGVRAAIAANHGTPRHADLVLAKDRDEGVRERLARKILHLAPQLPREERAHIRELTLDVIAILAGDRAARIREIVAHALKDLSHAPAEVIHRLARDVEIKVAGPILECSPLLSDDELAEIIASKPIQGALGAIARRRRLGMKLSDALMAAAVAAPDGTLAVAALLRNHAAEIDPGTMDRILDLAPHHESWHEPLVRRPSLSPLAIRRLASFVSSALLDVLRGHPDTDSSVAAAVAETVTRRLSVSEGAGGFHPSGEGAESEDADEDGADLPVGEAAIRAAIEKCKTDTSMIGRVVAALTRDSGLPRPTVRKILHSASPKALVALVWKAGYSMPLAQALQSGPGGVPLEYVLSPRPGDDGFPLSDSELQWQLELFPLPAQSENPVSRRASA